MTQARTTSNAVGRSVPVIGIVGGVASGKSVVANCFRELGGVVIDGDRLGHEALRIPAVIAALRERWGEGILNSAGEVDRRAVAKLVFAEPPAGPLELTFLESIVHPHIGRMMRDEIDRAVADPTVTAVVVDAAVMIEAGWSDACDQLIFVDAPVELRRQRAFQRGWTGAQFEERERAQLDVAAKRARADFVVPSDGTVEETCAHVRNWWLHEFSQPAGPLSGESLP